MDITRIGYTAYQNTAVRPEKASEKKEPDTTGTTSENQAAVQNRDTFVQTGAEKPVTYSRKLTDAQVQQLKDEQAQRMESFIQMLQSMVVKQGQRSNLTLFGMDLYVTPEQSRQAAESIAEGGEYSVDAVAGRIMDMAKALSGGTHPRSIPSALRCRRDSKLPVWNWAENCRPSAVRPMMRS